MRIANKILAAIIGGFLFSFLGAMVITLPMAGGGNDPAGWVIWALWAAAIAIVYAAKTPGKAWRRLLISCAVFSLMLPLATLIMSTIGMSDAMSLENDPSGASMAGAAIGGGLATVFTGFVSLFVAAIFLIIGLLVGKDKSAPTPSS